MTIPRLSAISLVVALAAPALGQVDPDPDGIGIYFDEGATITSTTAEVPAEITAYVVATNLSQAGGLVRWEANVSTPDPGITIWGGSRNGLNLATNMPPGGNAFSFIVSVSDPYPVLPGTVVLADLHLSIVWPEPIGLQIHGGSFELPTYWVIEDTGQPLPMYPSSGSVDLPVAVINGEAPVAAEPQTWGALHGLYR